MVSICLCTIDRYDLTVECVGQSLKNAGYPYELLSVDNGSSDKRVIDYIASLNPAYHRINAANEGYARMHNQMMLRAKGDYICIVDNDILMPEGWLAKLAIANERIYESGVSSIHCLDAIPQKETYNGLDLWPTLHPMGVKFFNRRFLNKVGYLDEEFTPYGHEDIALHVRSKAAGFLNYYAGVGAEHKSLHRDLESSEYAAMKRESVDRLLPLFTARVGAANAGQFYTPAPLPG